MDAEQTAALLARLDRLARAMEALAASNMALADQVAAANAEPDDSEPSERPAMSRKR